MAQLFRNNAVTTLAAQLNAGATSMTLTDAASFPDPGADFYLATLVSVNGSGQETAWEIVRVTAKAGSTLTVTRAQESTADVTWPAGTPVQMRLTAGSMDGKANATHTHVIADTTGLQAALDGKAATSHSHAIADVTGLQAALDGKQATLVSGTSIKTVNGSNLLGSGDLAVGDVTLTGSQTLTNKTLTAPVLDGAVDATGSVRGGVTAVAALNIDCSAGNYFTKTISGNSTFTVSNVPASRAYAFTLELTHTSGTITWFSGVEWPGGTAPSLTTGKTHLFTFVTQNGGTRWRGVANTNYTN